MTIYVYCTCVYIQNLAKFDELIINFLKWTLLLTLLKKQYKFISSNFHQILIYRQKNDSQALIINYKIDQVLKDGRVTKKSYVSE